ncbi:MAG: hypothetical protein HW405_319 [Candidatus Berkelbacteria bacterium]|nr:hypothetical protein [Candidatus Berkelbacteria bacterium]
MAESRRRIIEVTDVRPVIVKQGAIYKTMNQGGVLDTFGKVYPSEPPTLTIVYFSFIQNPIHLEVDIATFLALLEMEVKDVPLLQICRLRTENGDSDEPFLVRESLPGTGYDVAGIDIAHLVMHLLLFYAVRCREPFDIVVPDDFPYEDRVYVNQFNPNGEAIGAFNFPTRTAHVHILADYIADYLHMWSQGEETTDFQERMINQSLSNDASRIRTT